MSIRALLTALATMIALALAGCYPVTAPWMSSDGKYVALVDDFSPGAQVVTARPVNILNVKEGTWQECHLPGTNSVERVQWVGAKLLVYGRAILGPGAGAKAGTPAGSWWLVDPGTKDCTAATALGTGLLRLTRHNGAECLVAETATAGEGALFSLPDLKPLGTVKAPAFALDQNYSLVFPEAPAQFAGAIHEPVRLVGPTDKADGGTTIDLAAVLGERDREQTVLCVYRLAADRQHLLLGFLCPKGTEEQMGAFFGVFDPASGKLQWQRKLSNQQDWVGEPQIVGGKVYLLEDGEDPKRNAIDPTQSCSLVCYSAEGRKVVLTLPVQDGDAGGLFTVAPDGKQFVVLTQGEHPRITFVPIGEAVTAKELREVAFK